MTSEKKTCRVCGCTDDDCSNCIALTGKACHWVEPDLCSACADRVGVRKAARAAYVAAVEAALDADAASAAAWSVAYAAWDAIAGRAHGRARAAPASTCGKLISFDCADGEVDDCAPVVLLKKRVDLYGEALRDHLEEHEARTGSRVSRAALREFEKVEPSPTVYDCQDGTRAGCDCPTCCAKRGG